MHYQILLPFLLLCTCVRAQTVYTHGRQLPGMEKLVVDEDLYPFYHGVASGDPLEDRVIIWTRVTPDELTGIEVSVAWRVATDPGLKNVVRQDSLTTGPDRDYTVKVDVDGLTAGTTYYYGFTALERNSLTGRSKTVPAGEVDQLRFGVVSCSNLQAGYFNAYGRLAERNDLDAIVHLGDYLYEYGNFVIGSPEVWDERVMEPDGEIVTLFDYRTRFSTYHLDEDLLRLHQQHPMIAVWDDHEFANNSYADGATNHQDFEGSWEERKNNSRQAYFEWMPVRETDDRTIYRSLSYGKMADLIMIDTRIAGRDQQLPVTDPNLQDNERTMLGEPQKKWLFDRLNSSQARWKLIGNQVIFSEFNVGWAGSLIGQTYDDAENGFMDIWDGYPAERRQIVAYLREEEIANVVILTGDFHTSMAFEVANPPVELKFRELDGLGTVPEYLATDYDPETGEGAVAVEFASPSVASGNFDESTSLAIALALQGQLNTDIRPNGEVSLGNPNPHMKYVDLTRHGYFLLDVTEERVQADYYYTPVLERTTTETFDVGLSSPAGGHHLTPTDTPAPGKAVQDAPAPAEPPALIDAVRVPASVVVLSVYPNPTVANLQLQYALRRAGRVTVTLLDTGGRQLRTLHDGEQPAGLYTLETGVADLPSGAYRLRIMAGGSIGTQAFVKR